MERSLLFFALCFELSLIGNVYGKYSLTARLAGQPGEEKGPEEEERESSVRNI